VRLSARIFWHFVRFASGGDIWTTKKVVTLWQSPPRELRFFSMALNIGFDNSYGRLPKRFYTRLSATPVAAPKLIRLNVRLAAELGLDVDALANDEGLAVLAGNAVPGGADPLAQAYAGHQFGGWSPSLGDGRALLLGEILAPDGRRVDLQLKGSGPTPYSRSGDGRAWLGPVLREYIVSEAMYALGIPTTRALAAVATGETVWREEPRPGAVLTRVASSHIRVGTFQYFAARKDRDALAHLEAHARARHYPQATSTLEFLAAVVARQADLIASWMAVGFIHGVMNTDNCQIAGETIDYGPCAFMDAYHPAQVFSSIDRGGRYAFGRQPEMAYWNLAQFATSLLDLIDDDAERAVAAATEVVQQFAPLFEAAWVDKFRAKIGLQSAQGGDATLIGDLLELMAETKSDFTNTFRGLTDKKADAPLLLTPAFAGWHKAWERRRAKEGESGAEPTALMQRTNPAIIPRNHQVEAAIKAAVKGDYTPFERLTTALAAPYSILSEFDDLRAAPLPGQEVTATFCGT